MHRRSPSLAVLSEKMNFMTLFIIVFLAGHCLAISKQWLPNTNYDNPVNWKTGRLPCSGGNIVLGARDESVSVYLQSNSTLRELVLPNDGVIVLGNDMTLAFTDEIIDPSCQGEDSEFIGGSAKDWFKPQHWKSIDETVVPETELVPCVYDDVIFPKGSEFHVKVDMEVSVKSLAFNGRDYTSTKSFQLFLQSTSGKDQFTTGNSAAIPQIYIEETTCTDATGCPCGNDHPKMLEKICGVTSCYSVMCKDAVTPVGGCCPKCGGILTLEYNKDTFVLDRLKKMVKEKYSTQAEYSLVLSSVSKTKEDKIQVVCVDHSDGRTAVAMTKALNNYITHNMAYFGITNITASTSGKSTAGHLIGGNVNYGMIVGIIIAIVIAIVICAICTLLYKRGIFYKKESPLSLDMELDIAEYSNRAIAPHISMSSFDNPMYDVAPIIETPDSDTKYNPMFSPTEVAEENDGTLRGFSNPVDIESSFDVPLDDSDIKKIICDESEA
ncbi:protein amnionless-like isoform X2 [Glandiceps talaboti]